MPADTFEARAIEFDGESLVKSVTVRLSGFGKLTTEEQTTVAVSLARYLQLAADAMNAGPARMKSIVREMRVIDTTLTTILQRLKGRSWEQVKELAVAILIEGFKTGLKAAL